MAAVRAIIPGQIKDEEIFKPLETALSRYPAESWELVIGTASAANFDNNTVEVVISADNTSRTFPYDHLVLATGSRCPSSTVPWKAMGSYEEAIDNLHTTTARVKDAQSIVVAGAGSTGIEVAGELGFEYGKTKSITLLCSGDQVLGGTSAASAAANELKKLNVNIKYGAFVKESRPNAADKNKTDVVLADGEIISTDVYLPTTGLIPNTEYIPARYLNADPNYRTVLVNDFLQVEDTTNVWACGDVVSKPRAGFFITQKQAASVARNLQAALAGQELAVAKGPPVDIFACSVGRGRGVGRINDKVKLPSLMVWLAKGRTLALQMMPGYIDGSVA